MNREQLFESVQASQTSVVMLQTGIAAIQPVIEQLGISH
jgi:hypothetical protein